MSKQKSETKVTKRNYDLEALKRIMEAYRADNGLTYEQLAIEFGYKGQTEIYRFVGGTHADRAPLALTGTFLVKLSVITEIPIDTIFNLLYHQEIESWQRRLNKKPAKSSQVVLMNTEVRGFHNQIQTAKHAISVIEQTITDIQGKMEK